MGIPPRTEVRGLLPDFLGIRRDRKEVMRSEEASCVEKTDVSVSWRAKRPIAGRREVLLSPQERDLVCRRGTPSP